MLLAIVLFLRARSIFFFSSTAYCEIDATCTRARSVKITSPYKVRNGCRKFFRSVRTVKTIKRGTCVVYMSTLFFFLYVNRALTGDKTTTPNTSYSFLVVALFLAMISVGFERCLPCRPCRRSCRRSYRLEQVMRTVEVWMLGWYMQYF